MDGLLRVLEVAARDRVHDRAPVGRDHRLEHGPEPIEVRQGERPFRGARGCGLGAGTDGGGEDGGDGQGDASRGEVSHGAAHEASVSPARGRNPTDPRQRVGFGSPSAPNRGAAPTSPTSACRRAKSFSACATTTSAARSATAGAGAAKRVWVLDAGRAAKAAAPARASTAISRLIATSAL